MPVSEIPLLHANAARITVRHEELSAQDILDVANGRGDDTGTPAWMGGVVTTIVPRQHSRDRMS